MPDPVLIFDGESAGQTLEFNGRDVAGVTVHQLSLAPGLELDYAVRATW